MHMYGAHVNWVCEGDFAKGRYSRAHDWAFDGGTTVRGSASPLVVPEPWSDAAAVDPEEAFVAAVASCHMLWLLDIARRAGLVASEYSDAAKGHMTEGPNPWIARVDLYPTVAWSGGVPDRTTLTRLHDEAHKACFIANSIKSDVVVNL